MPPGRRRPICFSHGSSSQATGEMGFHEGYHHVRCLHGHIEHYLQTPKDNNSLQRCHRSIPIRPRVLIRSSTVAHARRLLNRAAHGGLDDTRVSLCKVTPVEHPPASPLGLLWWHGMGGGNWYPRSGVPRAGAAVCSLHAGGGLWVRGEERTDEDFSIEIDA